MSGRIYKHAVVLMAGSECEMGMSNCVMEVHVFDDKEDAIAFRRQAPEWTKPHLMIIPPERLHEGAPGATT